MKNRFFILLFLSIISLFTKVSAQDLPSGYVDVSGTKVFVEGGGNPKGSRIILVHAGFQDHAMWYEQAKDLMKDHMVIMLDLPGHGKTKDGAEPPTASDVIRVVMDSLQVNKASLVRVSFGGSVVTDFALAHPDRVNKLILVSSGLTGWDEKHQLDTTTRQFLREFYTALSNKDTAAAAEVFTHNWFDGLQRTEKTVSPLLRNLVYTTTKNNLRLHHNAGWPTFATASVADHLNTIKIPTLILTGTLDLPEVLLINGYLANNIPNATQVMVSGAAHMINLEKPERFNTEVRKFID